MAKLHIQIDVYKDFVLIGSQRIDRRPNEPAGEWLEEWQAIKAAHDARVNS